MKNRICSKCKLEKEIVEFTKIKEEVKVHVVFVKMFKWNF